MTTLFPVRPAQLHANVHHQAKRLKDSLQIPLTAARRVLAKAAYQCSSWHDLLSRLESTAIQHPALMLSMLPDSPEAKAYLHERVHQISRAIGCSVLTNRNLAGMYKITRFVFENSDIAVELPDLVQSLSAAPWLPSCIGPDPLAVLETYTTINGVPMKLIGTRVYFPEYLALPVEFAGIAKCAANYGTQFEIMWSQPEKWYAAACTYLSIDDDEDWDKVDFEVPQVELTNGMQNHLAWFQKVLQVWDAKTCYGGEDEMEFIPLVLDSGCYLVFGVPSELTNGKPSEKGANIPANGDNDHCLVVLDGQPLCVESLSFDPNSGTHSGCFSEYFDAVRASLFTHPECDGSVFKPLRAESNIYFVTPASQWDIEHAMKLEIEPTSGEEVCTVKTDHIQLTDDLLSKVTARDVYRIRSALGTDRYIVALDGSRYEPVHGFSLALDLKGEDVWSGSNLTTTTISTEREDGKQSLYVELNKTIFSLVELVGKKSLLEAARHGLVLQRQKGFRILLGKTPNWCDSLAEPSMYIKDMFERPLDPNDIDFPFGFWGNAKLTKYRRDNY